MMTAQRSVPTSKNGVSQESMVNMKSTIAKTITIATVLMTSGPLFF